MDVLIDTDPGGDDAIALMWLASLMHQGRLRLRAVSTTAGNVGARRTFRNAAGILALCGLDGIPIGIAPPARTPRNAAAVHGEDGIGNLADTLPVSSARGDAAPASGELLRSFLKASPGLLHVLAIGPLTNLSLAEAAAPGALNRAQSLIVMGGALGKGNITRSSEFNFFYDPGSAARVLAARAVTQLVTLDISQSLRLSELRVERIAEGHGQRPLAEFFAALCRFMSQRDARLNGGQSSPGFPVHDAATVAWLAYPELFRSRPCRVTVDAPDSTTPGRLQESHAPESHACLIASEVDAESLLIRLEEDLRILFARA